MSDELKEWLEKHIPVYNKSVEELTGQEVRNVFMVLNYAPLEVQKQLFEIIKNPA